MARTYTSELKAQAIAEVRVMGKPEFAVAKSLGVPRSTLQRWLLSVAAMPVVHTASARANLEELIFEYLSTGLQAAISQHKAMADAGWQREQPGESIAAVYRALMANLVMVGRGVELGSEGEQAAPGYGEPGADYPDAETDAAP